MRKKIKTPIAPWAFIRAKNEIITIDTCLKSILPAIQKGVIGFNDCDDGTQEYIYAFCKKHPGFIPVKYPHKVYPLGDEVYKKDGEKEEQKLHSYCNAVLAHIPQNEWFIKIDCDHVYDAQKLKETFYLPIRDTEYLIYPRLHLHYQHHKLYFFKKNFYVNTEDLWLIKNTGLSFFMDRGYGISDGKKKYYCWEQIIDVNKYSKVLYTELLNWHFPCMKKRRSEVRKEDISEFQNIHNLITPDMYITDKKTMLDEARIIQICETFNVAQKRILP